MCTLMIIKHKYPMNETLIYEYSNIDNLLMELKLFITEKKINKYDNIRIEVENDSN